MPGAGDVWTLPVDIYAFGKGAGMAATLKKALVRRPAALPAVMMLCAGSLRGAACRDRLLLPRPVQQHTQQLRVAFSPPMPAALAAPSHLAAPSQHCCCRRLCHAQAMPQHKAGCTLTAMELAEAARAMAGQTLEVQGATSSGRRGGRAAPQGPSSYLTPDQMQNSLSRLYEGVQRVIGLMRCM